MNNVNIRPFVLLFTILGSSLLPEANANACEDSTNIEDKVVQELLMPDRCWVPLVSAGWADYSLSSDWDGAGLKNACLIALPFAKMIASIYVINYTLTDSYSSQWHNTADYFAESRAIGTGFHNNIYNKFAGETNGNFEANSNTGRILAEDRTQYYCSLFSGPVASGAAGPNSTSERAAVIAHEMWHHWQHTKGYKSDHMDGPNKACTANGPACDWFYPHTIMDFDFNQLNNYELKPKLLFHSPYQIAAEFACDLAEMSVTSTPNSVTQAAKASANLRLSSNFVNVAAYRCGDPRPFGY